MRKIHRLTAVVPAISLALACTPAEERAEQAREAVEESIARGDREAALDAIEDLRSGAPDTADAQLELAQLLVQCALQGSPSWSSAWARSTSASACSSPSGALPSATPGVHAALASLLFAGGAAYQVQLFLYNRALARIQGFEAPVSYVLGRGWKQRDDRGTRLRSKVPWFGAIPRG